MNELLEMANEIRSLLDQRRKEIQLSFEEENHRYEMLVDGELIDELPSVSGILDENFTKFDKEGVSLKMCEEKNEKAIPFLEKANGDVLLAQELLKKSWEDEGTSASNFGSYTHFKLEQYLWSLFDVERDFRKPEYTLTEKEHKLGISLTRKGVDMIHELISKGCVPIDTEVVMGSPRLGYFGQADNIWLCKTLGGKIVVIFTDWKTNKSKNMVTNEMYDNLLSYPLDIIHDNTIGKYSLQQPLYALLFKDMLKGTKYEDLEIGGFRILKLRDEPEVIKVDNRLLERAKILMKYD